ncbi:MAG TPA: Ku protein [Albitalea sp.]|uniref:non-homologous end joining protein Ku n=1 Tax=Piscinibacter sp. TaxID=1903157 RepID=UPI002ED52E6B
MATSSSSRTIWKGAISFGLVHIPVALHSATIEHGIDFDWLDKRSMDPVGYKRINKKTGKEIDKDNIIKGIQVEDGQYVVLTDEEIKAAYPRATQTIEIEAFVPMNELPFVYLDRPYYLAPVNKGEKVYALLRETLLKTGRAGIARVVIQTKQHLAALVPSGPALILNLLRWGESVRTWDQLDLPAPGTKAAGLKENELKMAEQLVDDMTAHWDPEKFHDTFTEEVMKLVNKKIDAGDTERVIKPEAAEEAVAPSNIVDLTELLQRSLRGGKKAERAPAKRKPAAKRKAA